VAKRRPCKGVSVRHEFSGPVVSKGYSTAEVRFKNVGRDFRNEFEIKCKYTDPKSKVKKLVERIKVDAQQEATDRACALVKSRCKRKK